MESCDLLLMARRRAGITQQQLGDRSGHPRETIVRWETGAHEPSLATLRQVVKACDLELVTRLAPKDTSLDDLVSDQLELAPPERLDRLLPAEVRQDARQALRWVASARTPAIVIGAIAAVLQGAPQRAERAHVEIVSSDPYSTETEMREDRLTPIETEGRWADVDRRAHWALPDGGTIVLATETPGTTGYADLRRSAEKLELDGGMTVAVAHPRDLLRLGEASTRASARARVPGLRVLLTQRRRAAAERA